MSENFKLELSKIEAVRLLSALKDKCERLTKAGDNEVAQLLEGLKQNLARAQRRGEKLELELPPTELTWVLTAVREKLITLRQAGKVGYTWPLQAIMDRIVAARDATK